MSGCPGYPLAGQINWSLRRHPQGEVKLTQFVVKYSSVGILTDTGWL